MPEPDHEQDSGLRNPSALFFQHETIRRSIIASYWAVIILALPLWWKTTSIERFSLPSVEVYAQGDVQREFQLPVKVALDSAFDSSAVKDHIRAAVRRSGLDIQVTGASSDGDAYTVLPSQSKEILVEGRNLFYPAGQSSDLAETLEALLIPTNDHRVAEYSPRYRLSFTLFNEHSSTSQVVSGWEISTAIERHIAPLTSALSILHNFTIESQVQFYAPLAFEPIPLEDGSRGLTPEQLTVFINSAEWTLSSSSSNDPVLHFILFVPSSPLKILNTNANSFLIPQRGGIVIADSPTTNSKKFETADLKGPFRTFSNQLGTLLGLPKLPSNVHTNANTYPSSWQLDILLRQRTLQNLARTSDTLRSTVTLVDQIPGMPVTANVRDYVKDALKILRGSLSGMGLTETLERSSHALTLSQKAFFHPGMLALLYFPTEHKYAVYTPLFASAIIPLFAAAMREVRAWRRERRGV